SSGMQPRPAPRLKQLCPGCTTGRHWVLCSPGGQGDLRGSRVQPVSVCSSTSSGVNGLQPRSAQVSLTTVGLREQRDRVAQPTRSGKFDLC
ncbi:hypothetical protein GOODEAATRI_003709, partial [Goodea atripinnis]